MERVKSKIPFVGLHAHSVAGSIFDALGYPSEHMDFAYKNGMDALALTDHGNANGLAYQVIHETVPSYLTQFYGKQTTISDQDGSRGGFAEAVPS